MRVAIHQPEYLPWLGLLDKARRVDAFVLLDNVQFDRSSLQHRAKVVGANGPFWLTIPFVHRFPQRIDELAFADDRWRGKHWKSLQSAYGRAPGWKHAAGRIEAFFAARYASVVDATVASVELLFEAFAVRPPRVVRASSLAARGDKADLVLAICRELGATTYVSGRTGATYLDHAVFAAAGVTIEVQQLTVPVIPRPRALSAEEARGVSALDAWALVGEDAARVLAAAAGTGGAPAALDKESHR
jgi:hypothetical protein